MKHQKDRGGWNTRVRPECVNVLSSAGEVFRGEAVCSKAACFKFRPIQCSGETVPLLYCRLTVNPFHMGNFWREAWTNISFSSPMLFEMAGWIANTIFLHPDKFGCTCRGLPSGNILRAETEVAEIDLGDELRWRSVTCSATGAQSPPCTDGTQSYSLSVACYFRAQ